jgi:transketolase
VGQAELRRYGTITEHDAAHRLDVSGLRRSIDDFFTS